MVSLMFFLVVLLFALCFFRIGYGSGARIAFYIGGIRQTRYRYCGKHQQQCRSGMRLPVLE